ncbi:MAG: hypothetical protein RLZZ249_279 [Actinomycetota bacterium]|jgi:hypothetical protein
MEYARIDTFTNGWFIGDFHPSILRTGAFEVCFKELRAGFSEPMALQIHCEEVTLVISGRIRMGDLIFAAGDVVRVMPGEPVDLTVLEDSRLIGIKTPSLPGDKRTL